ncbi:MAG: OmpA family protein [Bacteroidia bacterium]|nr:OmpA family protein [Bacteroidia bacterium]
MKAKLLFAGLFLPLAFLAQQVQWASKVIDYSSQFDTKGYSANQVLGKPSCMPKGGDNPNTWSPSKKTPKEFIKVGFSKPMKIQQVIICEAYNASAVTKVELFDASGKAYKVHKGKPKLIDGGARMLYVKFPMTEYEVVAVKITVDLAWNGKYASLDAIGISESADEWIPKPVIATDVNFVSQKENLGENVNSTYDELLPVISPDGKTLFICRDDDPKGKGGQDIWVSELQPDGKWGKATNPGEPLNNSKPNFVCSVTPDGNKIIVGGVYQTEGGKGISYSMKGSRGKFEMPSKLPIKNYYNKNDYNEYCMANSGKYILMTVERDDTYGDKDIYFSMLLDNGEWSEPVNIGNVVNTASGETSPFLAADDKTLYFSSAGHMGYGSNDIFMTRRLDDTWTNWSEPVNLGPAINTPEWDAYYTIPASGDYAYFTSSGKTIGGIDVFRVKLPKEIKPDPVALVSGKVYNQKTREPLKANISYILMENGKEVGVATTNPTDGSYMISLPFGKKYGFSASAPGFIAVNENLDLSDLKEYKEVTRDLYLVPIEVGQTVRLNNIFFESGKWDLLPESYMELDKLVKVMNENPTMEIEIEGHTDDVGSDAANLTLSRNRAKSVLDYLVSKGVNAARIKSNGFGETKPIADNKTDDGKALNRRVQFTISKK